MVPNHGTPEGAVVIYQDKLDCSDPTHVAKISPVANAVTTAKPVYNQCGQLVGYIGSVVKNAAAPVTTYMI